MIRTGKYGVQKTFTFVIPKAGSTDFAASGDWTPAAEDTKISKDGGNVANTTNAPSAVGGTGSVLWTVTLTATEMQAAVIDIQIVDAATKAVTDQAMKIYTHGNASAEIKPDWSDAVRMGLTALPNAAAEAAGGLYTRGTGAGQINQATNGNIDANAVKLGGTTQTGRDVGLSVLLAADQAVNCTKWNGHAVLEVVNGSPVTTLGGTQGAYAPAKAGDAMTISVGTGTGQINVASGKVPATIAAGDLATDSLTADALKADAVTEIAHGLLDHAIASHLTAGTLGNLVASLGGKMTVTGNQLIVYAANNTTELFRFDLTDASTNSTMTDVYTRTVV